MDRTPYKMALKATVQKLKAIDIRKFARKVVEGKKAPWKKGAIWKKGISHGHHVVEKGGSVAVQRGQVGHSEVWLFGAFDQQMGDGVIEFLESHLLEKQQQSQLSEEQLSEKQIGKQAKEMVKAYINAATSRMQPNEMGGSAFALVLNNEKIVAADFGGYKAVLCERGTAVQIGNRRWKTDVTQWSLNGISGRLCGHRTVDEDENNKKGSFVVDEERVGSKTEFMILASCGIWEVLRDQEAVDLIRHIEDAQEAAKCLADEAQARMTKSPIVCIVIRFKRRVLVEP